MRGCVELRGWKMLWSMGRPFKQSFKEVRISTASIYKMADAMVRTAADVPVSYQVRMDKVPRNVFSLRKNLFSTLFQSMYHLLDIEYGQRILFGQLNCLFRIWVTSADNLLDNEDKVVLPLVIPGGSGVMQQVVSVMTADRLMDTIFMDAVKDGILTDDHVRLLRMRSLQVLLPSAAQEASEEAGVFVRPKPDEVLSVVHCYKTGVLFHVPFLGPEVVGGVDVGRMAELKSALFMFGMGCQLLDDIRDVARDFKEQRQNYLLSWLYHEQPEVLDVWREQEVDVNDRLYNEVPQIVLPTVRLAVGYMQDAWKMLEAQGFDVRALHIDRVTASMFAVLDLEDIACHG